MRSLYLHSDLVSEFLNESFKEIARTGICVQLASRESGPFGSWDLVLLPGPDQSMILVNVNSDVEFITYNLSRYPRNGSDSVSQSFLQVLISASVSRLSCIFSFTRLTSATYPC